MKPVIIITIAFVLLLLPLSVFAQEESLSELAERLDAENLQKAQEQSGSNIQQQESFKKIDCPNGYIEKAISGGGMICINEVTGQRLDESTMINFDEAITYTVIGVILIIVIIMRQFCEGIA